MSVEIQRRLISVIRHIRARDGHDKEINLRVLLHPTNLERLRTEDEELLLEIEQSYGARSLLPRRSDLPRRKLQDHRHRDRTRTALVLRTFRAVSYRK